MNYLAHLALAPDTDASRIGNLLGDFIKGDESSLRLHLAPDLVEGIMLHRAIDKFTDAHPAFRASKALLAPQRRRFAGIAIDIIYDHFLSIHWHDYYHQPLPEFIQQVYRTIEQHKEWQIGTLARVFPTMKSQNWLARYASRDGIALTLKQVAQRGKFTAPIADIFIDFNHHYHQFDQHFTDIYPALIEFVNQKTKMS